MTLTTFTDSFNMAQEIIKSVQNKSKLELFQDICQPIFLTKMHETKTVYRTIWSLSNYVCSNSICNMFI